MDGIVIPIVIGVLVLVLGGVFVFLRMRPKEVEIVYHHFRCPNCGRKFRYRTDQAGHRAKCPQCNEQWTFPHVPPRK